MNYVPSFHIVYICSRWYNRIELPHAFDMFEAVYFLICQLILDIIGYVYFGFPPHLSILNKSENATLQLSTLTQNENFTLYLFE